MLDILSRSKFKYGLKFYFFGFLGLLLAGCDAPKNLNLFAKTQPIPDCPIIRLLKDTDLITVYRSGPGRNIMDIRFEGEIIGFKGECEYFRTKGVFSEVKVALKVDFKITRGPREKMQFLTLPYFIAIPEFYPSPSGRSDFIFKVKFPINKNVVRVSDQEVEVLIPLSTARKGPESKIYIGFQLTAEQLEFNRQKPQVLGVR